MKAEKKATRLAYLRSTVADLDDKELELEDARKFRVMKIDLAYTNAVRKLERRRDKAKTEIFRLENKG